MPDNIPKITEQEQKFDEMVHWAFSVPVPSLPPLREISHLINGSDSLSCNDNRLSLEELDHILAAGENTPKHFPNGE